MKNFLMITLLATLGFTQAVAQEYEYVPLVREGVKWVYYYENPFYWSVLDMPEGIQYFSFELKGDVQIGDKNYKPIVLTHYLDDNNKEVEEFTPAYLREENKVVYAIQPDGILQPQCPIGIGKYVGDPDWGLPIQTCDNEFILYDFNDPIALYDSIFEQENEYYLEELGYKNVDYLNTDVITVGSHQSKRHHYLDIYGDEDMIIEGVGHDGTIGMPLFYFVYRITGFTVDYYFSHVIEDDEIIYKGQHYDSDIHVGIDEVVADQTRRPADPHYYNLMGQPVGTEVPTAPGIYIHNGKKIIVR